MSTATPAVSAAQVPPNIAAAQVLLRERLLPAKLDESRKENGHVFNAWLIKQGKAGLVLSMTAQQIADELYRAIQADVTSQFPTLVWEIPPKALTREQGKAPAKTGDNRESATFGEKVRASEAIDQKRRENEAAKKRCQELVGQFAPTDHRKGIIKFDLRDTQQAAWRKRIAAAKDFVKLEREIATEQRKIYESLERAAERV